MSNIEVTEVGSARAAVHPSLRRAANRQSKRGLGEILIGDLVRDGLLPFRFKATALHALALARFLRDIQAGWGTSGALGSIDLDRTRSGPGPAGGQPGISTQAMAAANSVLERLHDHEVELLKWLVKARERSNVSLATLGHEWCGVEEPNRAQGAATGVLQAFARSVVQHHPSKVWIEACKDTHERRVSERSKEQVGNVTNITDEKRQHEQYKRQKVPR